MKKAFCLKLKILSEIFLVSNLLLLGFLVIKYTNSQTTCTETSSIALAYIESPIFDIGTSSSITKFLWKGTFDSNGLIKFTLYGGNDPNLLNQSSQIIIDPFRFYILQESPYIINSVRYLKYRIDFYKCSEDSIPRVDQIYIYYSY